LEVQRDFRNLLALFIAHRVDYIVVGAYALAFHGAPRFTGDMDILVRPDTRNARRIIRALDEFGFASLGLTAEDFLQPGKGVQQSVERCVGSSDGLSANSTLRSSVDESVEAGVGSSVRRRARQSADTGARKSVDPSVGQCVRPGVR
jgi:hypothetical protein